MKTGEIQQCDVNSLVIRCGTFVCEMGRNDAQDSMPHVDLDVMVTKHDSCQCINHCKCFTCSVHLNFVPTDSRVFRVFIVNMKFY